MDQKKSYADERLLIDGCIYCGEVCDETREHAPSKVFLDFPWPENLPVVSACTKCNNGYSLDEEYVACLIESVIAGSTDPEYIKRSRVSEIFRRSPALRARIEAAKSFNQGQTFFAIEHERVRNVLVKLARGHAVFELNKAYQNAPTSVWWKPLVQMTHEELESFEAIQVVEVFGEVGTRGMQRHLVTQVVMQSPAGETSAFQLLINDWVDVQEGRYRYHAIDDEEGVRIKIVISEYLGCEICWE